MMYLRIYLHIRIAAIHLSQLHISLYVIDIWQNQLLVDKDSVVNYLPHCGVGQRYD